MQSFKTLSTDLSASPKFVALGLCSMCTCVKAIDLVLIINSFFNTTSENSNSRFLYPLHLDTSFLLIGGHLSRVWTVSSPAQCGGAAWCSSRAVPVAWPAVSSLRPPASVPVPRRRHKGCAEPGHWQDLQVGRLRNTGKKNDQHPYTDS